jgi:hypothetical protein
MSSTLAHQHRGSITKKMPHRRCFGFIPYTRDGCDGMSFAFFLVHQKKKHFGTIVFFLLKQPTTFSIETPKGRKAVR